MRGSHGRQERESHRKRGRVEDDAFDGGVHGGKHLVSPQRLSFHDVIGGGRHARCHCQGAIALAPERAAAVVAARRARAQRADALLVCLPGTEETRGWAAGRARTAAMGRAQSLRLCVHLLSASGWHASYRSARCCAGSRVPLAFVPKSCTGCWRV